MTKNKVFWYCMDEILTKFFTGAKIYLHGPKNIFKLQIFLEKKNEVLAKYF